MTIPIIVIDPVTFAPAGFSAGATALSVRHLNWLCDVAEAEVALITDGVLTPRRTDALQGLRQRGFTGVLHEAWHIETIPGATRGEALAAWLALAPRPCVILDPRDDYQPDQALVRLDPATGFVRERFEVARALLQRQANPFLAVTPELSRRARSLPIEP